MFLVAEHNVKSDHTRSTMQFTCNLCGCTTISPVNPHAFHTGSLFARCGNTECGVIHKVGACTCGFLLDLRVLCHPEQAVTACWQHVVILNRR